MKSVVLYFPYMINLKAFLLTERLGNIATNYGDPILEIILNDDQIQKACSHYGAVLV